jgi:hypothetical protein
MDARTGTGLTMSTSTTTPRVSRFPFGTIVLALTVVVLVAFLAYEHVKMSENEQRTLNAFYNEQNYHRRGIAALFLRAIVEDDYRAARLLLRPVAATPPRAPEGFGPEVKLKKQLQGWLKERNLNGKRFKGFERGGELPGGGPSRPNPDQYVQIGGLVFEDGSVVNYRLTLVRTNAQTGTTGEPNGWRVDDFILWSGERDGPRPW